MVYSRIKKDGTPAQPPGRKPDPNRYVSPGKGKGRKGPRPHTWLIGAEAGEYKHDMYLPWLRAKAQANFRKEGWDMTFEQFYDLWKNDWHNRGRLAENMCMTRKNDTIPWTAENTILITRLEHLQEQNLKQIGKPKKRKRKNV